MDISPTFARAPEQCSLRQAAQHRTSLVAAIARARALLDRDGQADTAHRILITALADPSNRQPSRPVALAALHLLVDTASTAGRPDLWATVMPLVRRLSADRSAGLRLRANVLADPTRAPLRLAASLDAAIRGLPAESNADRIARIAALAQALDRAAECREPLRRVLADGRAGKALSAAMACFPLLCAGDIATGRWAEALELADEGIALCEQHGHRLPAMRLRLGQAMIAAAKGDHVRARLLAGLVTGWAAQRGLKSLVDEGDRVLALSALGRGDFEGAYRHATAITRPGLVEAAGVDGAQTSLDLVESAARLGRHDVARQHVLALRDAPRHGASTRMAMLTAAAVALTSAPDVAEASFEQALAPADADRWPFDQARIQLAYGEHLRRRRRAARSRVLLSAALDTFTRLEAHPWAAQARHGLRATGVTTGRPAGPGAACLTDDERAVASLAASGLTNKEIARRLMVSHHTVAARLYQAFPKLGVGSRAALHDAMLALDSDTSSPDTMTLSGIA